MPKPHKKKKSKSKHRRVSEERVEDSLELSLTTMGLRVLPVEADGNCLFRAFGLEISGDESMLS